MGFDPGSDGDMSDIRHGLEFNISIFWGMDKMDFPFLGMDKMDFDWVEHGGTSGLSLFSEEQPR